MDNVPIAKQLYDATTAGDLVLVKSLIAQDISRLEINTPFGTMLHVAARDGHMDIVRYLVEAGAPVNVNSGMSEASPLHIAASRGYAAIVQYLFDHGAVLDVSEPTRNPLFGAIYGGHVDIARFLIESGIDTSVKYSGKNMANMDALAFARERGQQEIIKMLAHRDE